MKNIILVIGILFVSLSAAYANTNKYNSPSDIPETLKVHLRQNIFYEQYISQVLSKLREAAKDHKTLTKNDLEQIQQSDQQRNRQRQISTILSYDTNSDAIVTREEVTQSIEAKYKDRNEATNYKDRIDKQISQVMKIDTDNDNKITLQEMSIVAPNEHETSKLKNIENLLALDTNGDGALKLEELKGLADKVFNTLDIDNDGMISPEEIKEFEILKRQASELATVKSCDLPKPGANEKFLLISTHTGKTTSNISLAGNTDDTHVIPVNISAGKEKLFIVLTSLSPTIWQMTGDTQRIAKLVIGGPAKPGDATRKSINAGAAGVQKETVSFFDGHGCGLNQLYKEDKDPVKTQKLIEAAFGAAPFSTGSAYSILNARITGDRAEVTEKPEKPEKPDLTVPSGFEENTWLEHMRNNPGGIAKLSLENIVSDTPAAYYEVLPGWAGISKLMHEKTLLPLETSSVVIVTTPNGNQTRFYDVDHVQGLGSENSFEIAQLPLSFQVTKDIKYLPPGTASTLVKYIFANGVNPPQASIGNANIFCENGVNCPAPPNNAKTFFGIGAALEDQKGKIIVTKLMEKSPAALAGLKPNDEIVAIEHQDIKGMPLNTVIEKIRGKENTFVTLTVSATDGTRKDFRIKRSSIQLK